MHTILHISDLHRDSGSRISTTALLGSLIRDRERYTREGLNSPDLAIVSGDIVYGTRRSHPDAEQELARQYDEALTFLAELADTFFDGQRERIVVVPGNHDVSLSHVQRATTPVDMPRVPEQRALLAQQFLQDGTNLRWDWNELSMLRVTDQGLYAQRFEPFARFFESFYLGKRAFSLDPASQYSIHDFPDLGIVVAGFSSCYDTDPFNRTARIFPDCVAKAIQQTADFVRRGRLPIAVWHHSIQGGPKEADYLDQDVLQSLMDGEFALGMHGHQHRPQVLEHRFTADRTRNMVVVSAGTLCGGPHSLPTGRRRAYNLLVVDPASRNATIHVREMGNQDFSSPVWGPAYIADFSGPSLAFPLSPPSRSDSAFQDAAEAARLVTGGHYREAYALVQGHMQNAYARRVAVEALGTLGEWQEVRKAFSPPQSADEFIILADALDELRESAELSALLASEFAVTSHDPGVLQCIALKRARAGRA